MDDLRTDRLDSTDAGIRRAADLLRAGACVAFPTETVYGLGADARNGAAVAKIYEAKSRPRFNPLIVHVPDRAAARQIAQFSPEAERLADTFWPGPLSLVLPLKAGHGLSGLVTAGLDTVALRIPAHPVAHRLLTAFGGPVAAPSANPSGRISPTRARHVADGLSGRIAAILEGGGSEVGLESTIVAPGPPMRVLRPGGISTEQLVQTLGTKIVATDTTEAAGITAPGQLASHYAPAAAVRLNATQPETGEVMLGFGPVPGDLTLSETGDLAEAAANLFDMLHRLDATERPIAVAPIPESGLGAAINDRLRRAAAPRDNAR